MHQDCDGRVKPLYFEIKYSDVDTHAETLKVVSTYYFTSLVVIFTWYFLIEIDNLQNHVRVD